MATKSKFKKKFRTRLAPTEKQRSYIDRVSNPTSPADLLEALQDPSTPAYKQMMNLIAAREENQAIIFKLVERFLIEGYQASQREKEEIFKSMLAKEHTDQRELRPKYDQSALPAKSWFADEEKLKEKIENRFSLITNLKNEVDALNKELKQLDAKANEVTHTWKETTQRQRDTMLENLAQDKVQILSSSGKVIDKNDARYEALSKPAESDPMKVVSVVAASYALHQTKLAAEEQQTNNEKIENKIEENLAEKTENEPKAKDIPPAPAPPKPPPAPPDFLKHPKNMALKSCMLEELLFLAKLRDMDSSADMLKAIDNNKELGTYFPGTKKKLENMAKELSALEKSAQDLDPDLKARSDLFAKAIDINDKKTTVSEELMTRQVELNKQEMLQAVDEKALKILQDKQEKDMTAKETPPAVKHH